MGRPATILPTADDIYNRSVQPTWRAVSSVELSELLNIHLNTIWSWTLRRQGPAPAPDGLHVRASNRRFFALAEVLAWLSAKEGTPRPAHYWLRRWVVDHGYMNAEAPHDPQQLRAAIRYVEGRNDPPRKWKIHQEGFVDYLNEMING